MLPKVQWHETSYGVAAARAMDGEGVGSDHIPPPQT
jgi:hypothetical protein